MAATGASTGLPKASEMSLHRVCTLEELPIGSAKEVVVEGRVLALFNLDGQVHCLDGICPHAGGPLARGKFDGCLVTCPWHFWQFNVKCGTHSMTENIRQQTYEVEVRKGIVYVNLGGEDAASDAD
jgi:nitrite reductase/ring-hydroxylating ferredoxin subunit